jgi:hypothetical protein
MSLEYYLYCRKKYDDIICNLEEIIRAYELINCCTISEENLKNTHYELFEPSSNIIFFLEKKKHITKLKNICNIHIRTLCNHDFEEDYIDISPERSQKIVYCKICEYTK